MASSIQDRSGGAFFLCFRLLRACCSHPPELEAAQRDDVGQAGAICEVDEGEARPVQREARNHVAIPHTHTQPGAGTDRHDQTRHI